MPHARIGKVRMKSGGAEVRILAQDAPRENYCGEIVRCAKIVADYSEPNSELVGYVVIGMFSDGMSSVGLRWDNKRSPVPRALAPSYFAELIRRDLVTDPEAEVVACRVVNRANGFDD
jgi:hypothetical protein